MHQNFGNPPAPLHGRNFRNPDPRGCLASIAHGVLSWTLATKEDIMPNDRETFDKVLKGLQKGKAPTQAEREEAKRRLAQGKAQSDKQKSRDAKIKEIRSRKRGHGGDVIDTGMFGS